MIIPKESMSQASDSPTKTESDKKTMSEAQQAYLDAPLFDQSFQSRKSTISSKSTISRRSVGSKKSKHSTIKKEPSKAEMMALLGGQRQKPA